MGTIAQSKTLSLPIKLHAVLEQLTGETTAQKISHLLRNELRRSLQACEQELLELEIKYDLDHAEFQQQLEAGALGDEFGYELEMDALRWEDLLAEKKYYLGQLSQIREYL